MNEKIKLKKLKERYINFEHPHWTKEQWHKKIDVIFEGSNWNEKWDLKTQIIRELERCYTAPRKKWKILESELAYLNNNEYQRKKEIEDILEIEKEKRRNTFKKRVEDALKWYEQL